MLPILEEFAARAPGSLIEEKEFSVVWHYRMSDPEFSEWLASELVGFLEGMLSDSEVSAVRGEKSVEIRTMWMHKGQVVEELLQAVRPDAFQLALGNDRADEEMFAKMGPAAWTIRVRQQPSRARFWTPVPMDAVALLKRLVETS